MATKKTGTKKAAAKKPAAKKKTTTAVTKITPDELNEVNNILDMVNMDIGNAQVGRVFALRAGVGLLIVKDMCLRGEWQTIIPNALPHRAPRTIRGYMKDAKKYLDSKGLKASNVWQGLSEFNPAMLAQSDTGALMLKCGVDDTGDVPEAAVKLTDYINELNEEKETRKGANDADKEKKKKTLSKAQKRDAAAADLALAIGKVSTALNGDWMLVDTETLDTVASSLTVAAATIKEELKKRG